MLYTVTVIYCLYTVICFRILSTLANQKGTTDAKFLENLLHSEKCQSGTNRRTMEITISFWRVKKKLVGIFSQMKKIKRMSWNVFTA